MTTSGSTAKANFFHNVNVQFFEMEYQNLEPNGSLELKMAAPFTLPKDLFYILFIR